MPPPSSMGWWWCLWGGIYSACKGFLEHNLLKWRRYLEAVRAGRLSTRNSFFKHAFVIPYHELVSIAQKYDFPLGCQVMKPDGDNHAAHPSPRFIAVNCQHLESGFKFPVPHYLIDLLNDLELACWFCRITSIVFSLVELLFGGNKPCSSVFKVSASWRALIASHILD